MQDANTHAEVAQNAAVLHKDMSLTRAARRIMRRHADQMTHEEWESTDLSGWPSNRRKELRITVRRLRADMRLFAAHFKTRPLRALRDGARSFADVLDAPREYDMLIERARAYMSSRSDHDIHVLITEWKATRRVARERLADYLQSESHQRWRSSMFAFLDEEPDRGRRAFDVGMPSAVRHVAQSYLWQHLAAVYAFDVLPDVPRPEDLHELRIAVKRLRYFVDAWQDVLCGAACATLLEACAALQRGLGEINDAHMAAVHAVRFVAQRRDLRKSEARNILQFAEIQQHYVDEQSPTWRTQIAPFLSFYECLTPSGVPESRHLPSPAEGREMS